MNEAQQLARPTQFALAEAASGWMFDTATLAKTTAAGDVRATLESYRAALRTAAQMPQAEADAKRRELARIIGGICLRIRPDFSARQNQLWTAEMVGALADLPIAVAIEAAQAARKRHFEFPAQVLGAIHDETQEPIARHNRALDNLERLLRAIEHPTPLLPPPPPPPPAEPLSDEELQGMSAAMRSLGLAIGIIRQAEDGRISGRIAWT